MSIRDKSTPVDWYDNIQVGDHVWIHHEKLVVLTYAHHGIVSHMERGKVRVISFGLNNGKEYPKETDVLDFLGGYDVEIIKKVDYNVPYDRYWDQGPGERQMFDPLPRKLILHYARTIVNSHHNYTYSLAYLNCESFALFCTSGSFESKWSDVYVGIPMRKDHPRKFDGGQSHEGVRLNPIFGAIEEAEYNYGLILLFPVKEKNMRICLGEEYDFSLSEHYTSEFGFHDRFVLVDIGRNQYLIRCAIDGSYLSASELGGIEFRYDNATPWNLDLEENQITDERGSLLCWDIDCETLVLLDERESMDTAVEFRFFGEDTLKFNGDFGCSIQCLSPEVYLKMSDNGLPEFVRNLNVEEGVGEIDDDEGYFRRTWLNNNHFVIENVLGGFLHINTQSDQIEFDEHVATIWEVDNGSLRTIRTSRYLLAEEEKPAFTHQSYHASIFTFSDEDAWETNLSSSSSQTNIDTKDPRMIKCNAPDNSWSFYHSESGEYMCVSSGEEDLTITFRAASDCSNKDLHFRIVVLDVSSKTGLIQSHHGMYLTIDQDGWVALSDEQAAVWKFGKHEVSTSDSRKLSRGNYGGVRVSASNLLPKLEIRRLDEKLYVGGNLLDWIKRHGGKKYYQETRDILNQPKEFIWMLGRSKKWICCSEGTIFFMEEKSMATKFNITTKRDATKQYYDTCFLETEDGMFLCAHFNTIVLKKTGPTPWIWYKEKYFKTEQGQYLGKNGQDVVLVTANERKTIIVESQNGDKWNDGSFSNLSIDLSYSNSSGMSSEERVEMWM